MSLFWHAMLSHRTIFTLFSRRIGRCLRAGGQKARPVAFCGNFTAQLLSKCYFCSSLWFTIKDSALCNRAAQHLLKANSLCAHLHFVRDIPTSAPAFVFYGIRPPSFSLISEAWNDDAISIVAMEFNHVRYAVKPQLKRTELEARGKFYLATAFTPDLVYIRVQMISLDGKKILGP